MNSALSLDAHAARTAVLVCAAALVFLAVAMGVGRFAFTPLLPLMIRDGLITGQGGALLAASNYLGYLVGALLVAWIRARPVILLTVGLITTVLVTAAIGWTSSAIVWGIFRFIAGVMSAWCLVAASAWSLGWLAAAGRPGLSGIIFAGVGCGIIAVGIFCLLVPGPDVTSLQMWTRLGALSAVAVVIPLALCWLLPNPPVTTGSPAVRDQPVTVKSRAGGLIASYTLFGFGYILPATFLPELARQLVNDPRVFGWAWPVFGLAAAVSTVAVAWGLKRSSRLSLWAKCHVIMAIGVLLPSVWLSLTSVVIAALFVGGTFVVITMLGFQEARARTQGNATGILGQMTAGFALGQLMGPVVSAALGHFIDDYAVALNLALTLSASGLLLSAVYLHHVHRGETGKTISTPPV